MARSRDWILPAALGAGALAFLALGRRSGGGTIGPGQPGVTGPKGKGVFLRTYNHADSPEQMVALLKSMGMKFIFLPVTWQKAGGNHRMFTQGQEEYAAALRDAGIERWVWGWPEPAHVQRFVDDMMAAKDATGSRGIVVDAEGPMYNQDDAARYIASALRTETWALSSYGGGPRNHPGFPWEAFLDFGPVVGMPQLYALPSKYGDKYYARGVEDWAQVGYSDITPTLSGTDNHSPQSMAREAALTLRAGVGGLSYWDYYWLELSSKRRAAVASVRV